MSIADMINNVLSPENGGGDNQTGILDGPITETENYSDEKILSYVDDKFRKFDYVRFTFEKVWYRNLLYRHGNQWIIWDEMEQKWRRRKVQNWVPTPVTNMFASTGERLVSVLSRIEPNFTFVPKTDNEADISAAKSADILEDIICEDNEVERLREKKAKWLTYTGNCFTLSGVEQKENGEYRNYTDVFGPFQVYGDLTIEDIDNHDCLIFLDLRSQEYVKKLYGEEVPKDETKVLGLIYMEALAYTYSSDGIRFKTNEKSKGVVLKRVLVRPCEEFPEGLYAVVAKNKVLEKRPLDKTEQGEYIWPVEQYKFDFAPGCFFAQTPMNDIAPKQEQLNRLESLIELIVIRMASPVWLMPEGTIVRGFSGEPGAIIKYHAMGEKTGAPSRLSGENVPNSLFAWRESLKKDIEELANTFEAMKGQSPYSGAPGIVIETLIEQGLTRFGPALRGIAESDRRWMKTQMELFRVYPRERQLAKVGENNKWRIEKFNSADFIGAVDLKIESDSTVPRNDHAKQAKVLGAIDAKLVDVSDPVMRTKVLQKMRLDDLAEDLSNDIISAVRENELMATGQVPPVNPFLDNHVVHIAKHRAWANSEQGMPFRQVAIQHITMHNMNMDAENTGGPMPPQGGANVSESAKQNLTQQNEATAGATSPSDTGKATGQEVNQNAV